MRRFIKTGTPLGEKAIPLAKELCISPELAQALYNRGAKDADAMREFLSPGIDQLHDPFGLPDMGRAVERIRAALKAGERICIYGDYDVDGICATAMLLTYLRAENAEVTHYIPSRHAEGYGMNASAVAELKKQGVTLIITVDNGITALGEISLCRELGIDVVVTDHHRCMDALPDCVAVVDPARPDSGYENPFLCGAGVALKLIEALSGRDIAKRYSPFAGLATVADVVPLHGENRALTTLTLRALNEGRCPVGMQALAREANQKQLVYTAHDLSFGLAPRLNAAGRLGDAEKALSLFCETDQKKAETLARELGAMNVLRQEEERKILAQAESMLETVNIPERRVIVLHHPDWNSGIVGIVASRLTEKYYRPVLLFCGAGETITGSGRSIPGVNLFNALKAHAGYFIRFGGHAGAAGATMKMADLEPLSRELDDWLKRNIENEAFIPCSEYEFDLEPNEFSLRLAEELERLAPFGEGNPIPSFYVRGIRLANIKFMGQSKQHVRFSAVKNGACAETVAFQWGSRLKKLPLEQNYDMVCRLSVNEWQGRRRMQLSLMALEQDLESVKNLFHGDVESKFIDAILQNILYNDYIIPSTGIVKTGCPVRDFLGEDIAGALVLCFTPAGAQAVVDELSANQLRADVSFYAPDEFSAGYHAVVFAPVLDRIPYERYERILIYDTAISRGFLGEILSRAQGAEVFLNRSFPDEWQPFAGCQVCREGMKPHYHALLAHKQERYPDREQIVNVLLKETQTGYPQCALVAQVFLELGFFVNAQEQGWVLNTHAAQRRLEESSTYLFAASYERTRQEYKDDIGWR